MKRNWLLAAFGLAIAACCGAFLWVLWNFEMPEADIQPLTVLARANEPQLRAAGIDLEVASTRVMLRPEQIKQLAEIMSPNGELPRFKNKGGHPYMVWVDRVRDETRAMGYYYEWVFYSVGRDGIYSNEDDISVGGVGSFRSERAINDTPVAQ
jgi:hypothetical protein